MIIIRMFRVTIYITRGPLTIPSTAPRLLWRADTANVEAYATNMTQDLTRTSMNNTF